MIAFSIKWLTKKAFFALLAEVERVDLERIVRLQENA
jgi:hypothetical protein